MSSNIEKIQSLESAGASAIGSAATLAELEDVRIHYLGRKAELNDILKSIASLPPEEKGPVGKAGNQARGKLESLLNARQHELEMVALTQLLENDRIDITLPGSPVAGGGALHPITRVRREIEDVFIGMGYKVAEGPEVEMVRYNFDALNHSPNHPAREWTDTFYFEDDVLLRTHTSPVQIRVMEQHPPPVFVIVPGKVYRRDSDATHTPMFHQIEGLAVDEGITLSDLRGTLLEVARAIFGEERDLRLRPHFFPFTEPSVEVDVSCFKCSGKGYLNDGSRCNLCKGTSWIEVLGAGMVDPNVFAYVRESGYDPETVQGFAFGMGVERIAFLKHGIPDLRLFYENDLRLLSQFAAGGY
ncbi:MAG: phenylalanine--tRNA ligase subunit alpha [Solirubrobacterales bacterium]|nr:phenylalanine--tRNA ligase subunit alpha [Solirubrobacterales bacterium]